METVIVVIYVLYTRSSTQLGMGKWGDCPRASQKLRGLHIIQSVANLGNRHNHILPVTLF